MSATGARFLATCAVALCTTSLATARAQPTQSAARTKEGHEEIVDEQGDPHRPQEQPTQWLQSRTPGFDIFSSDSGGSWMLMGAFRVTSTSADGTEGLGSEVDDVGGQLGGRAHLMGTVDFLTLRFEAEGFFGGGREGIDADGAAHAAIGLAAHVDPDDSLVVRLGFGGRAFGNALLDVEIVQAPALEAGFQHHAEGVFVDVAPTAALVPVVHVGAGDAAESEVGIAALAGGRAVLGVPPVWATLDYGAVVADDVLHLGGGSFCLAPDGLSGCIDARFVAARLFVGDAARPDDVAGAYAGLSVGFGGGKVEK